MSDYRNALEAVQQQLGLPAGDQFTQEWVHELPDTYRTAPLLVAIADALAQSKFTLTARRILFQLGLDVANDLLSAGQLTQATWDAFAAHLPEARTSAPDLLEYWALEDEPLEDCFALTPLVRAQLQ